MGKDNRSLEELIEDVLGYNNPGEKELKRYFRELGIKYEDVTNNCKYWGKDIDFITPAATIEVKWDSKLSATGNIFIETVSNTEKDKPGWFNICEADLIYYGDAVNKLFYIFKREQLAQYIEENKDNLKVKTAPDYYRGRVVKHSKGYVIPVKDLEQLYTTLDVTRYSY